MSKINKKVQWGMIIPIVLIIVLAIFIFIIITFGIISSEREENKREILCKENNLYYETFNGCVRMCCEVLQDNGIHCYRIEKVDEEYYLNKFSKSADLIKEKE